MTPYALIFGTWLLAVVFLPVVASIRSESASFAGLVAVLCLGCSGSIVAVSTA